MKAMGEVARIAERHRTGSVGALLDRRSPPLRRDHLRDNVKAIKALGRVMRQRREESSCQSTPFKMQQFGDIPSRLHQAPRHYGPGRPRSESPGPRLGPRSGEAAVLKTPQSRRQPSQFGADSLAPFTPPPRPQSGRAGGANGRSCRSGSIAGNSRGNSAVARQRHCRNDGTASPAVRSHSSSTPPRGYKTSPVRGDEDEPAPHWFAPPPRRSEAAAPSGARAQSPTKTPTRRTTGRAASLTSSPPSGGASKVSSGGGSVSSKPASVFSDGAASGRWAVTVSTPCGSPTRDSGWENSRLSSPLGQQCLGSNSIGCLPGMDRSHSCTARLGNDSPEKVTGPYLSSTDGASFVPPPGYRLVGEEERKATLEALQRKLQELDACYSRLPLKIETEGQRRRQQALRDKIAETEQAVKIFSRPQVLVEI